jgi:hypothetical protein
MKVHSFQILSEMYKISTVKTNFILKHVPSDIGQYYFLQSTEVCCQQVEWYGHPEASSIE